MNLPQIIKPKQHADERGWFSETFREARLREIGINCRFVQDNQVYSKKAGTLRGLHFQVPPAPQAKLITVLRGHILDVAIDIRHNSPTYGEFISKELSSDSGLLMYIPVGFAHGYLTLQDEVMVQYKVSDYYAPQHEIGIRWDDPDIGVPWPMASADLILSDRDRRHPLLKEFSSPFEYDGNPLGTLVERTL